MSKVIWKQVSGDGLKETAPLAAAIAEHEKMFPTDPPDQIRLVAIYQQLLVANALAPGDYIELGSLYGQTLRFIHRYMDPARTLYSFDTFLGFDERDLTVERAIYPNGWVVGNFAPTSAEKVAKYLGNPINLQLVPGWFPDSFKPYEDIRWRFAHVDMDLYAPTLSALVVLWPRMVPGGVIMVHDYGCPGFRASLAVDEFCIDAGIAPIMLPDWHGTAVLRKPC